MIEKDYETVVNKWREKVSEDIGNAYLRNMYYMDNAGKCHLIFEKSRYAR